MRILSAFVGAVLVIGTVTSAGRNLVTPRGKNSWLTTTLYRCWRLVLCRLPGAGRLYITRDRVLEWLAALVLLSQLLAWLLGLFVGFTLLAYGVHPGMPLTRALGDIGSSLFTLGFVVPYSPRVAVVDFMAAAAGPILIALQIAYLPTMYAAYNRRENEVTLLRALGGEPPWGPELLARQCLVGSNEALRTLYHRWLGLASDLGESHSNYPVLLVFRSPHPYRSWIVSLLAILDAAAMQLACAPSTAPLEARLVLRCGILALRDIANARRIPYDPDPRPDARISLTFAEFRDGVQWAIDAGFDPERPASTAWPHFRGWRVNYEAIAYELARRTDSVPAPWSGARDWPAVTIPPQRPPHREPGPVRLVPSTGLADRLRLIGPDRGRPRSTTAEDTKGL